MTRQNIKNLGFAFCGLSLLALQGCAAASVADAAVSTTVFAGKTVVRGTVGAGKLVYRGGKAVAGVGRGNNQDEAYTGGPSGAAPPSCLEADGSYTPALVDANGDYYCAG